MMYCVVTEIFDINGVNLIQLYIFHIISLQTNKGQTEIRPFVTLAFGAAKRSLLSFLIRAKRSSLDRFSLMG